MTGESTLCTLLSSTKISLETGEDQGHHSRASPARLLISLRRSEAVLEPGWADRASPGQSPDSYCIRSPSKKAAAFRALTLPAALSHVQGSFQKQSPLLRRLSQLERSETVSPAEPTVPLCPSRRPRPGRPKAPSHQTQRHRPALCSFLI